jgi:hypothetical protein
MNIHEKLPTSLFGHYVILDATFTAALAEKKQVNKVVHLFGTVIMPAGVRSELSRSNNEVICDLLKKLPNWVHVVKANDKHFEEFRHGKLTRPGLEVLAVTKEAIERNVDVTVCSSDASVTNRLFQNNKQRIKTLNLCQFMTEIALWRMTRFLEREELLLSIHDSARLQRERRENGLLPHLTPGNQLDKFLGELEILSRKRPDRATEIGQTKRLVERQSIAADIEVRGHAHEQEREHGHERSR